MIWYIILVFLDSCIIIIYIYIIHIYIYHIYIYIIIYIYTYHIYTYLASDCLAHQVISLLCDNLARGDLFTKATAIKGLMKVAGIGQGPSRCEGEWK